MNVLITGANGQLGNEIRDLQVRPEATFHCLYTDVDDLDITNKQEVEAFIQNNQVEAVVNCAAFTDVDGAEENEKGAWLLNETAVGYLAETCAKNNLQLIHISTDYVFDGMHYLPYKETDQPAPQSVYGKSKLAGEKKVLENQAGIIIRTSWLYSSYGKNFVKTISRLSKDKEELKVIYDQIGNPTYASDLASAIFRILENKQDDSILRGIYHFSNEGVCSWYDLAMEIIDQEQTSCRIHPIETKDWPTAATRPHYSVFNKSKIKNDFGITIPYWKTSLKEMLKKLNR